MSAKQYGLIIPSKNKKHGLQAPVARASIFNEDSDSDTPQPVKPTGVPVQTKAGKQVISSQNKAIEQDPTVFQYDEIYDEMDQKRKDSKLARKDLDKKPKYITKLLAAADKRKRENERRVERQVQKEREAEGDEFKDKEAFVTSSYKKKLEELKILEEQEKREEYLENIGDVKKQGNLDGFYRHLYDQKINYEDKAKEETKNDDNQVKDEPQSDSEEKDNRKKYSSESGSEIEGSMKKSNKKRNSKSQSDSENHRSDRKRSFSDDGSDAEEKQKKVKKTNIQKRSYRSRKDSENDEDKETTEIKKEHLPSNLDADSDFSIDSSSDEENSLTKKVINQNAEKDEPNVTNIPEKGNVLSDNAAISKANENKEENEKPKETKEEGDKVKEEKPKKPKINIWKKRTVGVVFDEAVKRYFERKANRESAMSG